MRYSTSNSVVLCASLCASLCALTALPAAATGDVFAVLPTVSTGGVTLEAELATNVMRGALQEQSLAMVPANTVQDAVAVNALACEVPIACARLVGAATGATRVIASELWDQAGQFELRVAVVDIHASADPSWTSYPAADKAALSNVAEEAVLALAVPEAFKGTLLVSAVAGATIVVDGVERDIAPMKSPIDLSVGRHDLEVRTAQGTFKDFVAVKLGQETRLSVCTLNGVLTSKGCTEEAASPGGMKSTLFTTGMVGSGVGAAALVTGSLLLVLASNAVTDYSSDVEKVTDDNARGASTLNVGGIAALAVGGAALAVSAVVTGTSMVME